MKANLAHGQFAQSLFVFAGEVHTKVVKHLVGGGANMPHVAGRGEDTGVFEHGEGEVFYGVVRQGVVACHGEELDFAEAFPEDFDRSLQGPDGHNASAIAFEFCPRDGGICVAQMVSMASTLTSAKPKTSSSRVAR